MARSRRLRLIVPLFAALLAVLTVSGCSTGNDAVVHGGTFDFVSPGGKTEIFYNPPSSRGTIGNLHGPSLMDANKKISVDDYPGKVVVLNLWGQWCGPCRGEADGLEQVYQQTKDQGVQFIGINVRDQRSPAQDFVKARNITYPSIFDPAMRTLIALGGKFPTSVIPSTIVLDRQHRVAAVFLKSLLPADLKPVVERVAHEQAQEK